MIISLAGQNRQAQCTPPPPHIGWSKKITCPLPGWSMVIISIHYHKPAEKGTLTHTKYERNIYSYSIFANVEHILLLMLCTYYVLDKLKYSTNKKRNLHEFQIEPHPQPALFTMLSL